jgi:triosephosphate isomerase
VHSGLLKLLCTLRCHCLLPEPRVAWQIQQAAAMALLMSKRGAAASSCCRATKPAVVRLHRLPTGSSRSVQCQASKAKFFVGGNWKCNGTHASVEQLVKELNDGEVPTDIDVVVAPPFIFIDWVRANIKPQIKVSAQNCWLTSDGAFTGEISAEMLKDALVPWVITGHSERRSLCGESNRTVGQKTGHALDVGLSVIACVGETLDQRNSGNLYQVLDTQMAALFDNVKDWSKVVVAYEPVWAIGTGVVATPEQAQEVHAYLRKLLTDKLGPRVAEKVRIIYGGSVNDGNCAELARQEDIDGFLVGGASLKGAAFVKICNAQRQLQSA